jgi:hypothetical protein
MQSTIILYYIISSFRLSSPHFCLEKSYSTSITLSQKYRIFVTKLEAMAEPLKAKIHIEIIEI